METLNSKTLSLAESNIKCTNGAGVTGSGRVCGEGCSVLTSLNAFSSEVNHRPASLASLSWNYLNFLAESHTQLTAPR